MSPVARVLAHRGACRLERENTVAAFARAADLGADGVELDVHRTADGRLVVHHDAVAPGLGVLAERTCDDIRRALPWVPTLPEALDSCAGLLVNVEVKNLPGDADYDPDDRAASAVVELLHQRDGRDDVLVSSFNLESIGRVRLLDPAIPTGFLTLVGFDPLDGVSVAHDHGHVAVHPDVRSLPRRLAEVVAGRAHELEMDVNVWTVNSPDEMRRLAAAGVDSIITDVPDVAREVLDALR
jgi:glycerophosphoryl diester phosphodiesterase